MKFHKIALLVALAGFSGWSTYSFGLTTDETETASQALGAKMASEVKFDEGKSTLTAESKGQIRDFVQSAREKGKVNEIKVAAWADREYPVKDTKASKTDINLADARLKELKNYLKQDLKVDTVDIYNMTERPSALQKFLKTPTAKVKNTMEANGAAPKTSDETGLFGTKAQSSKAVLMIYMQ